MVVFVTWTLCVFLGNEIVVAGSWEEEGRRNKRYGCHKTEERKGLGECSAPSLAHFLLVYDGAAYHSTHCSYVH